MEKDISIANFSVGPSHPPFIIAEMSANHQQSRERALEIIEAAARAGVHAVKLQTYTADTMTIDAKRDEFFIRDTKSLWKGKSLYRLYQEAATPWEWHKPIFERCRKLDLIAFSSPFDELAVDFLEECGVPAYKIASFENNHLPLVRRAARTGKPLIISTGMASLEELEEMVLAVRDAGGRDIILLKCTSTYPADPQDSNLMTIPDLKKRFGTQVGLSDHTLGIGASIASIALGATVIERHFTLSRQEGGLDAAFSLEPAEMKILVEESLKAWKALGKVHYGATSAEKPSLQFRRSIFVVEDVLKGEEFTAQNIKVIRPGQGLSPKFYESLLNKKASCDIKRGTPLDWSLVLAQGT